MIHRAALLAFMVFATVHLAAQQPAMPRTPDGKPDLQGMWDSMTGTPVQRPKEFAGREFMTEPEADEYARTALAHFLEAIPLEDRLAGDLNDIYLDPKSVIDRRTALITDPPDGQIPPRTPEGQRRFDSRLRMSFDGPETRPLDERCLLETADGSSNAAPPMIPNFFGQNYYQIVQTPQFVLIYTEVVHDARIIRIGGQHASPLARFWLGDSIGHWEGDTLVVDTTNFNDKRKWRGSTENLHVVERFTRLPNRIRYSFTVDDPATWTRPWSGEVAFLATDHQIFEYACHEGNYAIENGLRGARADERAKQP
jgi:hypothetical protein